jgi:hypothetical protein
MSCGISEKAKVLTDKLDEIDAKIEETLNNIPGVAEAQAFADDLEAEIDSIKDKIKAQIPILGGGSLPPKLQSLQKDIEGALGYVAQGVAGVQDMANQVASMKAKWGDVDLGDIKDIDGLVNLIQSGAGDLDKLCSSVPNLKPNPDGSVEIGATPLSIPDMSILGLLTGDELPKITGGRLFIDINGYGSPALNSFSNIKASRHSP